MTSINASVPISWSTARYGHCLKQIRPSHGGGMYQTMNRDLSPWLRKKQKPQDKQEYSRKYFAYIKLLQRQRPAQRTFTGESLRIDRIRTARTVGERLHRAVNVYQPAESKPRPVTAPPGLALKKPVYTRNEVAAIFDKVGSGNKRSKENSKKDDENEEHEERKQEAMKKFPKSHLYYPASDVQKAVEEFADGSGQSDSPHRPLSARAWAHSTRPHQLSRDLKTCETKPNGKETSDRLANTDPQPEPETRRQRRVKSAPPESCRNEKKVSERELDEIITRLSQFDEEKWPPESRGAGRIKIYA